MAPGPPHRCHKLISQGCHIRTSSCQGMKHLGHSKSDQTDLQRARTEVKSFGLTSRKSVSLEIQSVDSNQDTHTHTHESVTNSSLLSHTSGFLTLSPLEPWALCVLWPVSGRSRRMGLTWATLCSARPASSVYGGGESRSGKRGLDESER